MLASFPGFPALLALAKSAPEPKKPVKPGNEANQTYELKRWGVLIIHVLFLEYVVSLYTKILCTRSLRGVDL